MINSVFLVSWLLGIPLSISVSVLIGVLLRKFGIELPMTVSFVFAAAIFFTFQRFLTRLAWRGYNEQFPRKDISPDRDLRRRAVAAAREVLEGKRSWQGFEDEFGKTEDPLIEEFIDLFEHEPAAEGLLGSSKREAHDYRRQIEATLQKIEAGAGEA